MKYGWNGSLCSTGRHIIILITFACFLQAHVHLSCAGRERDVPALHSGLKQDHVLKCVPTACSLALVGLEGGCEGRHKPVQDMGV